MNFQYQETLTALFRLSLWLVALAAVFVPLEHFFAVHPQKIWRKGIVADLGYYFLSGLLPSAALAAPMAIVAWAVHQAMPAQFLEASAAAPLWLRLPATMLVGEAGYYWGHRWSHEIPLLWRFHSIHHSAEHIDFLVNSRTHPVDMAFGRLCGLVPIYVLGLAGPSETAGTATVILVTLVGTVWGFFIHANVRWRFGPLEWLVSTPAFHHWHHTLKGPINRNYSSTFPWLDRIFGTYHLPADQWPEAYGIDEEMPNSLIAQLIYPLGEPVPRKSKSPDADRGVAIHESEAKRNDDSGQPGPAVGAKPIDQGSPPQGAR